MQGCPSTMYAAGAACTESSLTALTRSHRCDGNRVSGQRSTCGEPRATSTRHAMPPPHPARHASSLVSACHPRDAQTFERHPQRANAAYRGCVASHQHCSYVGFNVCAARGGGVPALCPTSKSLSRQRRLCTTRPTYDSVGASRTRTRCVVLVPGVSVELARPPSPQSFLRDRPGTVYDAINVPQCWCDVAHTRGGWQWLAAGGRACPQRVQLSRVAWVARERLHVTGCERWGGRTNIPRGSPQVERSAEPEVPRPSHAAARHSPHTLGSALSA
jgi:hypothetical protein